MAKKPTDNTALLAKAEAAFNKEAYASTYKYCSELMKGKTASVVVYMQCISSLKLRENTKDHVDPLIDDTLLLSVALDNCYIQSGMQNQNIVAYIHEILFCLLTTLIANVQKNYPFKSPKRSFKNAFSGAQQSITNIRKLKSYDFSRFSVALPAKLIDFVDETSEKLIAHVTNSINITKDITNNWLYDDETDDLFERIINYKSVLAQGSASANASDEPQQPIKMKKGEIKDYISDISNGTAHEAGKGADGEFALEELDEINIKPPTDVTVNENYTGEAGKVTVSQVLGDPKEGKPSDKPGKANTLSLTGKTQLKRKLDPNEKPETEASAEIFNTIEDEFEGFSIKKDKSKDVYVMPEALDDFTNHDRVRPSKLNRGKKSKMRPGDLLIVLLGILFIIAVVYIITYFL